MMMCVSLNMLGNTLWGQNENASDTVKVVSLEERLRNIISNTKQSTNSKMTTTLQDGTIVGNPQAGDMFVDFTVQQDPNDVNSKVSLSDYVGRGKYVILDFWASWCTPCIAELEAIRHAYQNLPKDKVTVIALSTSAS